MIGPMEEEGLNPYVLGRRRKRRRLLVIIGVIVVVIVAIPIGWILITFASYAYQFKTTGTAPTPDELRLQSSAASVAANTQVTQQDLLALKPTSIAPELGLRSARVTLVEFVDYQCPFCARNAHVIRRIMQDYEDRVRFLIRDYPVIDPTGGSREVALAANCILAQGQEAYWRFHDQYFTDLNQSSPEALRQLAASANVRMEEYDACMESRKYDMKIDNDIDVGKRVGVSGTPTFFVNGAKVQGYLDEALLRQILDQTLESLPQ
ncbi:thioredoxin domain-containing protein [Candidatus Uhrbacteria bacterium]|nr:thioredoxin domain-containing protein [Candidatus Uhrbacteria bacterium]MBD3284585.1 thioredoxin domain-containing protein [Candidatus Uhrbacteria bacterium]